MHTSLFNNNMFVTLLSSTCFGPQHAHLQEERFYSHSTQVESGLQSALNLCSVQTFTESENTRCCVNKIFPPEDGRVEARNM
jgi:hypothetical protein